MNTMYRRVFMRTMYDSSSWY